MNSGWVFVSQSMQFALGIKQKAKHGTLGVTASRELVLYGDKGEVLDQAPISQIEFKFSSFTGDSVTMNGHRWRLAFAPSMKTGGLTGGIWDNGLFGEIAHSVRDDVKAGKRRREGFKMLIERIQTEYGIRS